jgi:hypothetical protein
MKFSHSIMAALAASAIVTTAALAQETLMEDMPKAIDGVETVCDGVSIENRNDSKWRAYALRMEFVGKGGQYLGGQTVNVKGNEYDISVQCKGPWVLMKLPAGSYHLSADVPEAGHKEMNVLVPANGQRVAMFVFPNAGGEVSRPAAGPLVASAN